MFFNSTHIHQGTFIDRTIHQIENKQNTPQQKQPSITTNIIPYIPGISEKIKRVGDKFQVKTVFKTENTMRSILTQTKPKNEEQSSKNCIYSIPCVCGKYYTGETKRPLSVRTKEHKYNIKKRHIDKSKLTEHILTEDGQHMAQWNNIKIIGKEDNKQKRKIKESACILLNGDNSIASCSVDIDRTWYSLLKTEHENGRFKIN